MAKITKLRSPKIDDRHALAVLFSWNRRNAHGGPVPKGIEGAALLKARDIGWVYGSDDHLVLTDHGAKALRPYSSGA